MYRPKKQTTTTLKVNQSYVGERIEQKIARIVNNKEPITDGAPQIFTERKDGVLPQYNIRTDRFEIAVEAMDKIHKTHLAKREERAKTIGEQAKQNMEKEDKKIGGTEPIQGTNPPTDSK